MPPASSLNDTLSDNVDKTENEERANTPSDNPLQRLRTRIKDEKKGTPSNRDSQDHINFNRPDPALN